MTSSQRPITTAIVSTAAPSASTAQSTTAPNASTSVSTTVPSQSTPVSFATKKPTTASSPIVETTSETTEVEYTTQGKYDCDISVISSLKLISSL